MLRWAIRIVLVLLLLPVLAVAVVLVGLNTGPGRSFAERQITSLTGGTVVLQDLGGRFPDRLRLGHVELHDAQGTYLTADGLALDWSPLALLHKQALVHRLAATSLRFDRLPIASGPPSPSSQPFTLPVRVTVQQLDVPRAVIGAPVLGTEAALALAGTADVHSLEDGTATLALRPADGPGAYTLNGTLTPDRIDATLDLSEPAQGLLARIASLPDLGAIAAQAQVSGPKSALATKLALTAGPLSANAAGTVDLNGERLALDVNATAPAMAPAPGVHWDSVALQAHVAGPFTAPDATGTLRVQGLEAPGAGVRTLSADLSGNAGQVTLRAVANGLRIPGPNPALLAQAPLHLDATAHLDQPDRPVQFTLSHPLLTATGTARTAGTQDVQARIDLLDLTPLAALGAVQAAGHARIDLTASPSAVQANATLSLTDAPAPAPALLGPEAHLLLSAKLDGSTVRLNQLNLTGAAASLNAQGTYRPDGVDLTAKATLSNLALVTPSLSGNTTLDAHVSGPLDKLALDATLAGDVGAPGIPRAPVQLAATLTGLPGAPQGRITGEGTLLGAPLNLVVEASRSAEGAAQATIRRADWRSLHAEGAFDLAAGAKLPTGQLQLRMPRLDELRPLLGITISGGVSADVKLDQDAATATVEATGAGIPGSTVGRATLKARATDLLGTPTIDATLDATGIQTSRATGTVRASVRGPQTALAVKADADLVVSGTPATVSATATLDMPGKTVRLQTVQATARDQTVRLLAPATVRFADTVAVDRLRLGVQQAVLDVSGRLSPTLDATVTLRSPADVAKAIAPALDLDGAINLDAKLTGTPARPGGTVRLQATGVRARTGPGRSVPPANLTATAALTGGAARVDARLTAGSANLAVNGTAPLGAGPLALRATGGLDLTLLDPILTAAGRRAHGRLTLDATIGGTLAAPVVGGSAQLAGGEVQDFTQGVLIRNIAATVRLDGQTARIVSFTGQAGPGTIGVAGTVGVLQPGIPLDINLTMRNARPLASDEITANLDADITLRGPAAGGLQVGGSVLIRQAELRIPKTLPASVVTLDVRRPGQRTAPPPVPSAPIALDLTIKAPQAVFVRGRGVDAEMSGTLRIHGTSTSPQVAGGLDMRRGSVSIAGTTLDFTRGKVGFDGTGVSGKIDPTLDFVAESTAGGVTATLTITGYVSKPKIVLSSVPDLPQDEVLAYLIFKRSAKELGPFQIAEIAAALADLSGATGSSGLNPLESVRKGLGLDRLSLGAGTGSSSTPTLEAGRYVGNGVYVGAKQGTTGGQTQATVQIDITKGLKLETDVGSGEGGNSVGLTYQFEY